eukprot:TRINITY_DN225_c0_g1_i1.p1 TRINITY_DN225_c0_g1~~TRINITY_DN225_c0_g1_i1.p1  ORF type:complete len:673 (+),score=225.36 TRINITY_DN225_c0_g1_i1:55-2073(+)
MKCLCTFLSLGVAAAVASDVSPVQKVISLMNGMVDKGKAEMVAEQEQFQAFVAFCENTTVEKRRRIEESQEAIELLTARIEKASADSDQLSKEIAQHQSVIDTTVAEKENATAVREKEAADFAVALKDYTDSIDAMGRALDVLKEKATNRAQASLLQLASISNTRKVSPQEASAFLDAFLQGRADDVAPHAALVQQEQPVALGYESSSGGVVGMLEKLEDQFKLERMDLKKEELKAKNAYNTVVVGLDAENADNAKSRDRKTQVRAQLLQQKATDEADLAEAQEALKDDSKYKKDLETTWAKRTSEFKARQQLRKEELEALTKATEIVSGGAVSGASEKHLSLLQRATALVSMPSKRRGANHDALAKLLQERAQTLNSFELAAVARKLESAGPFDGVVTLIKDLIAKKQAEGAQESSKQQYCETEMAANKKTRSEKTDEVEALQAAADKINATIASLGEEVATLTEDIGEMKKAVSEATAVRTKEKTNNTATIADAKAAQAAVAQAINVLQEFYAKAGQATALVQEVQQQPIPEAMDSKPYKGMGAESGGVLGMMEVIQSDFARLETETTSAESAAASEYEEFMDDSKTDIASKEKDVEHKQDRIEREQQKLLESSSDLQAVQAELNAALKTFEELKPQCADAGASYEEQKRLREQEMATLQQALDALNAAR